MQIRSARISFAIALLTLSSARWRWISAARVSRVCQATVLALVDREVAERFDEDGSCRSRTGRRCTSILGPADPFERSERLLGRWPGSLEASGPTRRTFCRPAARRTVRRIWIVARSRPAASSASSTRSTSAVPSAARSAVGDHLGGGLADIGQPQPAQQPLELVGQRRRGGCGDGHRPNPSHARVDACSELSSRGGEQHELPTARCVAGGRGSGEVTVGEPARAGAGLQRPVDCSAPCSLARSTASAILRRTRCVAGRRRP